jgi:hypothetical protein
MECLYSDAATKLKSGPVSRIAKAVEISFKHPERISKVGRGWVVVDVLD